MYLSRHDISGTSRWAADGRLLPRNVSLDLLLEFPADEITRVVDRMTTSQVADGPVLAPIEDHHEVWAGGVTYKQSREARLQESRGSDIYSRVYDAERPELFFKALGWRVVGPGQAIRARRDARWTVPEPELVLVMNERLEIVGFCAGNDVSSRDIEGENALYLPQAKIYDGSCALGPGIVLRNARSLPAVSIKLAIERGGAVIFSDETSTAEMKRTPEELVSYLGRELSFPQGAFLMTGTSIVPSDSYSLKGGDEVTVTVGTLELANPVTT